jgi:hypothetical protein
LSFLAGVLAAFIESPNTPCSSTAS